MADDLLASTYAAMGALRQDVRSILAALGRLEEKVDLAASGVGSSAFCAVPGCGCDTKCNCHAKDWGESDPDEPV